MPVYITSRLPSSFPFNKTYVVAGTKEETTESRRGGCGTACSYTTGYCDCSSGAAVGEGVGQPGRHQGRAESCRPPGEGCDGSATRVRSSSDPSLLEKRSRQSTGLVRELFSQGDTITLFIGLQLV